VRLFNFVVIRPDSTVFIVFIGLLGNLALYVFYAEALTFDEFCDICRKEPATTEEDLMKAFRKIDVNGDGFISNSELRKMLTTVKIIYLCLFLNFFEQCISGTIFRNFFSGDHSTTHFLP